MDVETTRRQRMAERRKARMQQVRCQEKQLASLVRENYQQSLAKEREIIAAHLKAECLREEEMQCQAAEQAYQQSLMDFGRSHNLAVLTNIEHANSGRVRKLLEGRQKAEERHMIALQNLQKERKRANQSERIKSQWRKKVQLAENKRSMKVTAKPPPPQDILLNFAVRKGRRVCLTNVEGYSATYYHLNGEQAYKETPGNKGNAFVAADQVEDLANQKKEAATREQQERDEKAWLRHQHACKEIRLKRDYSEMMDELAVLERADRLHRQKMLQRLPKRVFVPPHRRIEEAAEMQREMERAFEEIAIQEECPSELNRSLDEQQQSPVLLVGPSTTVMPATESTTDLDPDSKSTASNHETGSERHETDSERHDRNEQHGENETPRQEDILHQDYDPMQQLLERVRAQRQAWADYYQRRGTETSILMTSSETGVNEDEQKELEKEQDEQEDEQEEEEEEEEHEEEGEEEVRNEEVQDEEEHREETEEDEDELTTSCEENGDHHKLSVDYSREQDASLAMPEKEVHNNQTECHSLISDDAKQRNAVKCLVSEQHDDGVKDSVTMDRAESDGSHQKVSVSKEGGVSSTVNKEIDFHQSQSVSYISPDDLVQHIHKQRKQYEDQRAMIMSQYILTTDSSSTLGHSQTGIQTSGSLSQQLPVFSHHNSSLVSMTGSVSQDDQLSVPVAMSCSLNLKHVAALATKYPSLNEQSTNKDSISHSTHESLETTPTSDPRAMHNTHQFDFNHVSTSASLAKSSNGQALDLSERDVDVKFAGDADHKSSHTSQLTLETVSQGSFSLPALDLHTAHQQFSQVQDLTALSSVYTSPPSPGNASQPHSRDSSAALLEDNGLEEQVHIPPAILLPSSSCPSPLSSGRHLMFSSSSSISSLIDLSHCVDFAQAFQEPGEEGLLADIKGTNGMQQQEKAATGQSTVSSTQDTNCDRFDCQQQPWAFYLKRGIDPPQLSNSNSTTQFFSDLESFTDDQSLPDFPQSSVDGIASGHLLVNQPQNRGDEASTRACVDSLEMKPDLSLLQTAGMGQGTEGEQGHSLSSGSQVVDMHSMHKGISLQEAFARHKKSFVETSQARQQQIQEKSRERQCQVVKSNVGKLTSTPLRVNTTSTRTKKLQQSRKSSIASKKPPVLHHDKRALQREYSERNKRLYERLPEVQQKCKEESRQAFYAANKSKAKLYSQSLHIQKQKNRDRRSGSTN